MFTNYFKVAFRNLLRQKGYSMLNIVGLSIGMACSTLILIYVQFELSYDGFHSKADRIYRVYKQEPGNLFIGSDFFAVVQAPLGKTMESEFPEVESSVKFASTGSSLFRFGDKSFLEDGIYWAEPTLFSIFDFPFLEGNPSTALSEPYTVVLSKTVAERFFGKTSPVGKSLRFQEKYDLKVTGVFDDPPENSHFVPKIVLSFSTYEATQTSKEWLDWGNSSFSTYILLRENADVHTLEAKLPSFIQKHMGILFKEWGRKEQTKYFMQPLSDVHLHSSRINMDVGPKGDIQTIYILSALAVVILLIACINYMNLATARAAVRAREVGVRKVVGAQRSQLIRQFLSESLVCVSIAALISFMVVELLLPRFSELVERDLPRSLVAQGKFLVGYLFIVLAVGLTSGSYPAFVLTSFQPITVLKGLAKGTARSRFRDSMVVSQFAASITLIVCAIVILSQLRYIRTTDLGYDRDHVLVVRMRGLDTGKAPRFKDEVLQTASVVGAASSQHLPINISSSTTVKGTSEKGEQLSVRSYQLYADYDFLKVYQIPLADGRAFLPGSISDSSDAFLVNETFVKAFGWQYPIGRTFQRNQKTATIIGVVKDFHMHSLHDAIEPLFIRPPTSGSGQYLGIRIRPENIPGTIASLKKSWEQFSSEYPFDYSFLDDSFNKMYRSEERLSEIISSFTILGVLVASLGLFGLAAFITQQRKKEIGVRKVLGASVFSVVKLLSREFLTLVAFANLLAWPLAYYLMHSWLKDFAYRISLGVEYFVFAGVAAILVALVTVSYQSIRAAQANPIEALRYE